MCEKRGAGKSANELPLSAIQSRVDRLLCGIKERATREMCERVAGALLMGEALDELYFEDMESLDGVEEAIRHIIGSAQPQFGNDGTAANAARTAVENILSEIEDTVKRAAVRVKTKQGTELWVCTRERIADLICAETLCCPSSGGAENEREPTGRDRQQTHYVGATLGPAVYRRLGMVALKEGNVHRDVETVHPPQSADEYVLLANEMEPGLAMAEYQKALALDPNHVMAHFFLAQAFQDVGNFEAAVVEFTQVTRLVPDDPDGHWCLGEALLATGEVDAAVAEYSYALSVAPEDEEIRGWYSLLDDWMKDRLPEQAELRPNLLDKHWPSVIAFFQCPPARFSGKIETNGTKKYVF